MLRKLLSVYTKDRSYNKLKEESFYFVFQRSFCFVKKENNKDMSTFCWLVKTHAAYTELTGETPRPLPVVDREK
jgi:hypothetical protein